MNAMVAAAVFTPLLAGFGVGIDAAIRPKRTIYLPPANVELRVFPTKGRGIAMSVAVERRQHR